ncbi:MAG: hypothetical protein DRG63_04410 [Deltaproteobacteria bacterium]|nr:MAG: hypothetical protein DRG63_04410 [Deltaproteobacteria bacterium]
MVISAAKNRENQTMELIFLGTGAAWGLPELNCTCAICNDMRSRGERRTRTALMLSGQSNLLIDCGPDITHRLEQHQIRHIDGLLITHEHGDHYLGLDELFVFKRIRPRGAFRPIPAYMTAHTWDVIKQRFGYLEEMGVIVVHTICPGRWFDHGPYHILPFKTEHGSFAKGSVGYLIQFRGNTGKQTRLLYTSDFMDILETYDDLLHPDYLVIQSFWLNEPVHNRPHHMSFQRAIHYIQQLDPIRETFLVHMGDADKVPGDPANTMLKKYDPKEPLRPPNSSEPYPIPLNHSQWQQTITKIMADRHLPHKVKVAFDGLRIPL